MSIQIFLALPFSEKFSQLNIKEPRSSLQDLDVPKSEFPNVRSHFGDIPKEESETKSGIMPSWTIKMPKLILSPEHFMINENPRNFVREQIEKASEETTNNSYDKTDPKELDGKKNDNAGNYMKLEI